MRCYTHLWLSDDGVPQESCRNSRRNIHGTYHDDIKIYENGSVILFIEMHNICIVMLRADVLEIQYNFLPGVKRDYTRAGMAVREQFES